MTSVHRHFKDTEAKINESLYNNILILSKFHPLSKDVEKILKKDMFIKNNKAAFHQTVCYLLNILNPKVFKEKITSWPIMDIKMETQFRHEILGYLNELNTIYEDANIPVLMASQLISPGGIKFSRFMFMLSQLVLLEHLKNHKKLEILHPIKPNKNKAITECSINLLKTKTAKIEAETFEKIKKFNKFHNDCRLEAFPLMDQISKLIKELEKRKKEGENSISDDQQSSSEKKFKQLETINEGMKIFQELFDLINAIKKNFLILNENRLEYKGDLNVPKTVQHIVKNTETLNLLETFKGIKILLERNNIELPNPSNVFLDKLKKLFTSLNESYEEVNAKCDSLKAELDDSNVSN